MPNIKVENRHKWQEIVQTVKSLDPNKLEIIKATLPFVKEHGEAITKHFYKRMYQNHPDLKIFSIKHTSLQGINQKH